jgi:hypothetical protein
VCAGPQAPACGEHGRRGDACGAGLLDVAFCERLVLAKLLAGDPPDVSLHAGRMSARPGCLPGVPRRPPPRRAYKGGRLGTSNLQALAVQAQHLMRGRACTTARTQYDRACTPACMRTGHRAHRPAGTLTVSREDAIMCCKPAVNVFFVKKNHSRFVWPSECSV